MLNLENTPIKPTESELEILQLLWEDNPATVRFIHDKLSGKRELGYTTTLKNMQNMLDKGLLIREIIEKSHFYRPAVRQEVTQAQVLRSVAEAAFGGSTASLVLRAIGEGSTTKEELEKIKALIEALEKGE
jgi:BlaI family transcriptional regulator, penicillinase repressor